MSKIKTIINYKDHPIDMRIYRNYCLNKLRKNSVLLLKNFLNTEILKSIQELSKLNDNIEVIENVVNDKWEGTNGN